MGRSVSSWVVLGLERVSNNSICLDADQIAAENALSKDSVRTSSDEESFVAARLVLIS